MTLLIALLLLEHMGLFTVFNVTVVGVLWITHLFIIKG